MNADDKENLLALVAWRQDRSGKEKPAEPKPSSRADSFAVFRGRRCSGAGRGPPRASCRSFANRLKGARFRYTEFPEAGVDENLCVCFRR